MKFYGYVLATDQQIDLTHPGRGRDWAYVRAIGLGEEDEAGNYQPVAGWLENFQVKTLGTALNRESFELENWFGAWVRNVRAFRSLARRLADEVTRPPGIKPLEADAILRAYLALPVRVQLDRTPGSISVEEPPDLSKPARIMKRILGTDRPLTRESIAGLKIRPGQGLEGLHNFWQDVFLSLIDERHTGPRLCQECRQALPPTAGGRPSRRVVCKRCQMKNWYANADRKKLRERNRKYKAERRAEERAELKQSPTKKGK